MIKTEFNENFGLDEIKRIIKRDMGVNIVYEIRFVNDRRILIATGLHCFLTSEGYPKGFNDLKVGDKIWVQTNELSSFKTKRRISEKK